ncbi:translocation/assembly module TamB domain-containing protein [Dysgonomonas sp. Marseille-P4677]|uniref:translocation/assembly module TamB domain-containing protein n=1 Tax=Dysgonomonas sp. Marseille-P4677 TaxID=2364790 RepID=UPI001913C65C|nr:translocation/assembly module TamB domain-containing protein [Dysgonomonas sp. Marseille-P4677]MBK5721113.1 translocation/assembly module TamB domain-containing protein [Dysgonomonas sp. Marseille-P4677]
MEEKEEVIKDATEQIPPKKSFIKKLLKVFLYIVLSIIGVNVLLYVLLSIPFIQQKVADFAVDQLKSTMKTEVSIDEVRLSLFNHVTLKGIYIEDQARDTLLYAKSLDASLNPWKFIKNSTIEITGIALEDFLININQKDSISDLNFQFVIDAFSSNDTTKTDTTKSSLLVVINDLSLVRGQLNYNILSAAKTPSLFNASHISVYDFNANLDLNSINPDKFDIVLNSLSAKERSGVEIKDLKGKLFSEKSQLWIEGLSLYLPDSHLKTNKVQYNLSTNDFEIETEDTEFSAKDLVAFLPNMKFLKNRISLKTKIKGILPSVQIDTINLTYGDDFVLNGKASLASFKEYGNSAINLSIDKAKASTSAITDFARLGDSTFIVPDILKNMGDVYLKGRLTGQLDKFRLDAEAWCKQGLLSLLATGAVDTTFSNFNVVAGLKTQNFGLGKLLGGDTGLGSLTARLNLKAKQSNKESLSAQVIGNIDALQYQQEAIVNVPVEGFYNVDKMGLTAVADWSIGKILVKADMSQAKVPDINVQLRVDSLHLDRFYKNKDWVNPRLTLALNGSIHGLDIDNITGKVVVDSLDFHDENFSFKPGKFILESGIDTDKSKYITLISSLLTAKIAGQYSFTTFSDEFTNLMNGYLPDVFQMRKRTKKEQNNFTFAITANNTEELGQIFVLPIDIISPATINGRINTIDKQLSIKGNIPHVRFGDFDINNTVIDVANLDSAFNMSAASRVTMDKGSYRLATNINGEKNVIYSFISINSDSTEVNIKGDIEALAQFSRNEKNELVSSLKITPSDIMIDRLALNLLPADILNEGQRTEIHNLGLGLNKKPYFNLDGVISREETDSLKLNFSHAEIGELLEAFDVKNVRGCIHGDVLLTKILDQPELYTREFEIADIVIFGDTLGTMSLDSEWSDDYGGVTMAASLAHKDQVYAELDGTVYTNQDSLDLQLRMEKMPLGWTQPFVSSMINKVSGTISSNLMVEGSSKAPLVRGFLGFNDTKIGVDYTNVVYTISDTIRVSPDKIGFENLTLKDDYGNTANVNATVTHKNFNQMKYLLNMRMNKLMVLNTEHRTDSLFYGRVFASGTVRIDGDDNGINMNMQVKNDKNSTLNILLPQRSEATDYKSVVYINVPEERLKNSLKDIAKKVNDEPLPMKLNVKLDVTPDLKIGVVIDPVTGDAMEARGSGVINFSYDMQNENMSTFGDYTLTEGIVKFNLQNIKKLDFSIRNGSKLYFIGDPLDTKFDITAFRRVRPDIKTLDASLSTGEGSTKVLVDCLLGIKGNMDKMDITYDISLVDAPDDVRARVNSLINTEDVKIRQFAYLVAMGAFYPSSSSSGANFGSGLWTGVASGAISGVLTSLMGNMLGDKWQIGANVESNDGTLSDMDMSVNVSRKFLDDRLTFKTNVGYHNDQHASANGSTFIGDFDLEYQLNSMWTLKAYSHTNEQYYRTALYTQGIGIVYSKEAATLKRLFQSFKPRRFRANQQLQSETPQNGENNKPLQQPSDSTQTVVNKQPVINEEKKGK